jgi:hypothetical protein
LPNASGGESAVHYFDLKASELSEIASEIGQPFSVAIPYLRSFRRLKKENRAQVKKRMIEKGKIFFKKGRK